MKKIHLNPDLYDNLSTDFYSERSAIFVYLFRIFIKPAIVNYDNPEFLEELKSNLDIASYENSRKMVFAKHYWRKINHCNSLTYFPDNIVEESQCFFLQDVLVHASNSIEKS